MDLRQYETEAKRARTESRFQKQALLDLPRPSRDREEGLLDIGDRPSNYDKTGIRIMKRGVNELVPKVTFQNRRFSICRDLVATERRVSRVRIVVII